MSNPSLQTILVQDLVFRMLLQSFQRRHPFFIPPSLSHSKERERTKRQSGVKKLRWVNKSSSPPAAPAVSIAVIGLPLSGCFPSYSFHDLCNPPRGFPPFPPHNGRPTMERSSTLRPESPG